MTMRKLLKVGSGWKVKN